LVVGGGGWRDHLQQASRAAHIAADLTRQMLAYTGRGRFIIEPIDVNELVQENAQFMRASIAKTVTLEVHLAASLPPIEADAGQVQQVIMNLVTNAADAVSEFGGRITVTTGLEAYAAAALQRSRVDVVPVPGVFVFLDVHDDGCGMDAATQERLFDPFFTTKSTGRGLGMSAILGIVHAHKGAIFVDSAPRQGTTFRVLFPACEADIPLLDVGESRPPGAALAKGGALRGTVLFVDDEAMIRDVGSMMLEHLGLKVLMAANGAEAVDLFRRRAAEIDCVLLDLSMPHMDGLAAMAELMRIRPTARVILSSGYDEQESVRRVPGGAVAFIQKPYTLDNLRKVLEETLLHPVD
jgi:CheY-like chemotaxis protein